MQVLQQLKGFIQVHSCIDQGGASGARQWYMSQCNKYIICTYILVQVLQQLKGFIQVHSCIDQGGASGARQWYMSQCNKYIICTYILVQVLQQLKGFIKSTAVLTKGVPVVQDSGTCPNVTNILFVHIY